MKEINNLNTIYSHLITKLHIVPKLNYGDFLKIILAGVTMSLSK